jgi:hypothetical protein
LRTLLWMALSWIHLPEMNEKGVKLLNLFGTTPLFYYLCAHKRKKKQWI